MIMQEDIPMSGRIAIPATAPKLDARMESKFGRAALLLLVEAKTLEFEVVENPARDARGGAGIETAELLSKRRVSGVIAEKFGPKAHEALSAAGISMFRCKADVNVREAISRFNRGELQKATGSEGSGGGEGEGHGGGHGRGRGRGTDRG